MDDFDRRVSTPRDDVPGLSRTLRNDRIIAILSGWMQLAVADRDAITLIGRAAEPFDQGSLAVASDVIALRMVQAASPAPRTQVKSRSYSDATAKPSSRQPVWPPAMIFAGLSRRASCKASPVAPLQRGLARYVANSVSSGHPASSTR
jgi:hypothetical protein